MPDQPMRDNGVTKSPPPPCGEGDHTWRGKRLPLPACHQGVYARLRPAMERVGVRGPFHKLGLVERPPHPPPTLSLPRLRGRDRVGGDLSPQAGRGQGRVHTRLPSPSRNRTYAGFGHSIEGSKSATADFDWVEGVATAWLQV